MGIYVLLLAAALVLTSESHHEENGPHDHNSYDSGENKCDFYEEAWKIREEGNSGKYEYYSSCDHNEHVIIEMETLTEMTQYAEETKNKIHSFSGGEWQYDYMRTGHHHHHHHRPFVAVTQNFYTGTTLLSNIDYNLTTMIIEEDVEDFNILEKYNVTIKDGVNKWEMRFSDWPWLDSNNYLRLCVKVWVQGDAGETNITTYLENDLNHGYKIYHFHNHMNMHVPEYYKCGLQGTITSVDTDIIAYSKNDLLVCFNFDFCEDVDGDHTHIEYDPFIYFGGMVKEDYQQDIDPYDPFIYTTPIVSIPCGGGNAFIVENKVWTFDLYSLLIGIAIGLGAALIVGLIICCVKRKGTEDEEDLAASKNDKKSNKKSKEPKKKDKKRGGFFTKVSSGDVDDD